MKVNPNKKAHSSFSKDVHSNKPAKKRRMWRIFFKFAVGTVFLFVMRLSALWILLPWLIYDGWPRLRQVRQLHYHMGSSVMRVGSDTFGDPIFQNSLPNQPSSPIVSILGCFAQLCQLSAKCENWTFKVSFLCQKSSESL